MRLAVVLISLIFTHALFAKDVFLSVSGKANGFFSDARIFNPSFDKDIIIQARYLPAGNVDNSGVAPVTLTISKRSMKVYDDALASMFNAGDGLGAIRLTSDDDFIASQRIYQDARSKPQAGTLGQFVQGLETSTAKTKGVLLQLKAGAASLGNFRTNWGGANPNSTMAHVVLKLYDKNNAVVSTKEVMFQPFGVIGPSSIVDTFATTADLTDAWISFTSDVPVFLYGSVVDNGSVDPTFIAAETDSGVAPPPPPPQIKTVTIHANTGSFGVTGLNNLVKDDQVKFVLTGSGNVHGIRLFAPDGTKLFEVSPLTTNPTEKTITLSWDGTYQYVCTNPTCSELHTNMFGEFIIGEGGPGPGDRY